MASLPPRQVQRRSSPSHRSDPAEETRDSVNRSNSAAQSTTSHEAQTVLLNNPASPQTDSTKDSSQPGYDQTFVAQDETREPRKCWICLLDETEDQSATPSWRTPCPCALTAHEECLLDWIADVEKPDGAQNTTMPKEIKCPQCKARIHLSRPRSMVVEAVNLMEKAASKLMLPGIVAGIGYTIAIGASHHGAHTVRMIFGAEDSAAILAPQHEPGALRQHIEYIYPELARVMFRDYRGARLELGLPLIPLTLIASRTTIADAVLPVLPILFFATHPEKANSLTSNYWPPSAALTLVVLPYLRGIYDDYLERVWGERERGWLREIQPRSGEEEGSQEEQANQQDHGQNNDQGHNHGGEDGLEIRVEINLDEDENEAPENEAPEQERRLGGAEDGRAAPPDGFPLDGEEEQDPARRAEQVAAQIEMAANNMARIEAQQMQARQQQQQQGRRRGDTDLVPILAGAANMTFGALMFPTIAAASGEVLRALLPAFLTAPKTVSGRKVPTGLLQTRWGRSIIGGCLFVVLKDAIRIYCRWRMAQAFRTRRILDWDKVNGKVVEPS